MPEYLAPGVYVEEVPSGIKPIEGVSTSTAGFVGGTERGPTDTRLITSFAQYQRVYGWFIDPKISYLPYAIRGFFDNGGMRAFVARVAKVADEAPATEEIGGLGFRASGPGGWGARVRVWIGNASSADPSEEGPSALFRVRTAFFGDEVSDEQIEQKAAWDDLLQIANYSEDFDNLTIVQASPQYVKTVLNSASHLVRVDWTNGPERPTNTEDTGVPLIKDGAAEEALDQAAILGRFKDEARQEGDRHATGLRALADIDPVSILVVPDQGRLTGVAQDIITQCETLKDRFGILQGESNWQNPTQFLGLGIDSHYVGIYHPWIRVFNPKRRNTLLVPAGGHVAGIYARTDVERGVHKAPANEVVRGMIAADSGAEKPLAHVVSKGEHDLFNPRGINIIRDFRSDGRGIRVWGARTFTTDPEWKYINVRRLFLFLEESIDEGTQWVVFEPNDDATWAKVRRNITNFLTSVWRSGALFGLTPDEAFFVKCDRTTMTEDDILNGRLICLIGVAPVRPAEFVIFRISQKTALPEA
jgi:phage tail sheath protein FI